MSRSRLAPHLAVSLRSLRNVGYEPGTALAALIDNAVATGASTVWVRFAGTGRESTVSILDDGRGLSAEELDHAIHAGEPAPTHQGSSGSLEWFGAGLRLASVSQCSRWVVASRQDGGPITARVSDLRATGGVDEWSAGEELTPTEAAGMGALDSLPSGTLVLWRELDRLLGTTGDDEPEASERLGRVAQEVTAHLALTFHRLLDGPRPRLRLYVGGDGEEGRVFPRDPFYAGHASTQQMPEVRRGTPAGIIVMQGFVLPHRDRIEVEGSDVRALPGTCSGRQGFHVYLEGRLLIAGSWLGLGRAHPWTDDPRHALARIRLDLPPNAAETWSVDITRSRVRPPPDLIEWLTRNAERVRHAASEVFVHRGNHVPASVLADQTPLWQVDLTAPLRYRLNRGHPLITSLLQARGAQRASIEATLAIVESTVPVHRIWLDVAADPEVPRPVRQHLDAATVRRLATELISQLTTAQKLSPDLARRQVSNAEPFDLYPDPLPGTDT